MTTTVKNPALRYYGGKFRLGWWIASNFPEHQTYVEPFGGAAGVLLRKEPAPVEVYNDLDGNLVNFFRVIRQRPQELIRAVKRTPYSREEFEGSYEPAADELECARRYFVRAWQSFGGPSRGTGWKVQKRTWTNSGANHMGEWFAAARNLVAVSRRFQMVQIESDDALTVIQRFDGPETLFYCDPPYLSDTRNETWCKSAYKHEFSVSDHLHLGNLLCRIRGMAAVSTYPHPMYDEMFAGWERIEKTSQTMNKTVARELVYLSPRLTERRAAE